MTQLPQRLRLDLTNPLTGDLKVLTHLFQRVIRLLSDSKALAKYALLSRGERRQDLASDLF